MQFTLRQRFKGGPVVVLWLLISVLCGLSGPFGTLEGMGFWMRLGYWAVLVGLSILGSLLIDRLSIGTRWVRVAIWAGFAVTIAGTVFLLNGIIFGGTARTGTFLYLTGIVGATVLVVHGMLWLAFRYGPTAGETQDTPPDVAARFQRRLALEVRGPLVRIEAQDHYLNVVTRNGAEMILLRLSEAVAELEGAGGLQTHRSHWVSLEAVTSHRRVEGRDILVMSDGADVPVARTRRAAAKEAGLL